MSHEKKYNEFSTYLMNTPSTLVGSSTANPKNPPSQGLEKTAGKCNAPADQKAKMECLGFAPELFSIGWIARLLDPDPGNMCINMTAV